MNFCKPNVQRTKKKTFGQVHCWNVANLAPGFADTHLKQLSTGKYAIVNIHK